MKRSFEEVYNDAHYKAQRDTDDLNYTHKIACNAVASYAVEHDNEIKKQLAGALQELHDWQNGRPLETPKWIRGYDNAVMLTEKALANYEESLK